MAWSFWARCETLRGEHHWTAMELCRRAQVRRQTYSELQRTTRRPQRHIITQLAGALQMDQDEALGLAGLNPTDSDMVRRAITAAHDLDEHQKRALLILLDGYDISGAMVETPAAVTADEVVTGRQPAPAALFQAPHERHLNVARIA